MNITIEKKNFEKLNIQPVKEKCGQALDEIWNSRWLRSAITKEDRACLGQVYSAAALLTENSEAVVVLAEGILADQIRAAVTAAAPAERKAEVIVFGESLSPADYAGLLEKLENLRFSVLLVSDREESLPLRGAYAVLKKLLITKFGKEQAAERIAAVLGKESRLFAREAAEEDYPQISAGELPAAFSAGSPAVLLPLAAAGVNLEEYLDGFYEMLASPAWDRDAADYAAGRAACGDAEILYVWQRQLEDFAKLQGQTAAMPGGKICGLSCAAETGAFCVASGGLGGSGGFCGEAVSAPQKTDGGTKNAAVFETLILTEEDEADIMMPFFEGCNEDGSLNLLIRDTAKAAFDNDRPGAAVSVEVMNDRNLGQLFAFFQLSKALAAYLASAC